MLKGPNIYPTTESEERQISICTTPHPDSLIRLDWSALSLFQGWDCQSSLCFVDGRAQFGGVAGGADSDAESWPVRAGEGSGGRAGTHSVLCAQTRSVGFLEKEFIRVQNG